ncbi:MAG: hypothetical protein ABI376_09365 [Caulobacteraceae bacterium]
MKTLFGFVLLALLGATSAFGQAAPSAPAAPSTLCGPPAWRDLRPLLLSRPARAISTGTLILPQGDEGDIVMLGPVGSRSASLDDYQFRVFVADRIGSDALPLTVEAEGGMRPLHVDRPTGGPRSAEDQKKDFDLRLYVPGDSGWVPWRSRLFVVVACQNGAPVAWGVRRIETSRDVPSWALAGALVLALYLMAATMVYIARRQAIAKPPAVPRPLRVTKLTPWSWWDCLDPVVMTSDRFDRGSLSNLQVLFFGGLVAFGLTDLTVRSGALSDLSSTIVYLLGIPALGALGTGIVRNTRDRLSAENWSWLVARGVLPVNDSGKKLRPRWSDLIMTDTVLDLPKLQALTFSLIVGIAMIATGFRDLADFNVPSTLLQILGLSQVVFVGGKFTEPTTIGDLDDLLDKLRDADHALKRAAASGRDVDSDGKVVAPPPAGTPEAAAFVAVRGPYLTMAAAGAPAAVPNAVQRYRDLEEEAAVLLRSLVERDVHLDSLKDPLG